jgi:hypothetical protein
MISRRLDSDRAELFRHRTPKASPVLSLRFANNAANEAGPYKSRVELYQARRCPQFVLT